MDKAEKKRQEWLAKKKNDSPMGTFYEGDTEEEKEWGEKLATEFKAAYSSPLATKYGASGVLGEKPPHHLYRKNLTWDENGVHSHFWGVKYALHGNPVDKAVWGMEMAKSNLFQLPLRLRKEWLLAAGVGLTFLFRRKRFYDFVYWWLWEIHWKVIRHLDPQPEDYSKFGRELKRATRQALIKSFNIDNETAYHDQKYYEDHPDRFQKNKAYPDENDLTENHFGWVVARFVRFARTFLELDFAYRFRTQDVLAEIDKENLEKDGIKEFERIFGLLHSREARTGPNPDNPEELSGQANVKKWGTFGLVLKVAFYFEPKLKTFIVALLSELDIEKIKMDENDWYFCLGWTSYNYGGLTYAERMQIRKELDKKNKHAYWKLWNYEF